jgi:hypothetical protein
LSVDAAVAFRFLVFPDDDAVSFFFLVLPVDDAGAFLIVLPLFAAGRLAAVSFFFSSTRASAAARASAPRFSSFSNLSHSFIRTSAFLEASAVARETATASCAAFSSLAVSAFVFFEAAPFIGFVEVGRLPLARPFFPSACPPPSSTSTSFFLFFSDVGPEVCVGVPLASKEAAVVSGEPLTIVRGAPLQTRFERVRFATRFPACHRFLGSPSFSQMTGILHCRV